MNRDELEVNQDFFIPAPISNVWNFLMNEEKMSRWLNAEEFVIDIWEGGGFVFPYSFRDHQCNIIGEVTILLENEKYAVTWWEREPSGDEWLTCTTVTLNLKEKDEGTHIALIHNGFKYLPPEIGDAAKDRYAEFWKESGILERLDKLISADVKIA